MITYLPTEIGTGVATNEDKLNIWKPQTEVVTVSLINLPHLQSPAQKEQNLLTEDSADAYTVPNGGTLNNAPPPCSDQHRPATPNLGHSCGELR